MDSASRLNFDGASDSPGTEKTKVLAQWETWERIFAAEVKAPHHLCLGNHDVYGWARRDLAAAPAATPVCVLSHIPILSSCVFFDGVTYRT
jgi:hypothetical protein